MVASIRPRAARRALALGVIALSLLPALAGAGHPGAAHAAGPVRAGFFNNSEYPIVSLTVDSQQVVPGLASSIAPKGTLTLGLSEGPHTFAAQNGLSSASPLYTFSGTMTARFLPGTISFTLPCFGPFVASPLFRNARPNCTIFNDPSITALLTRFGANGTWSATFFDDNSVPHVSTFTFRSNGGYTFAVDGAKLGVGRYTEVGRDPNTQTITFNVGGSLNGIFSETGGTFLMRNDPHGNAIEYS